MHHSIHLYIMHEHQLTSIINLYSTVLKQTLHSAGGTLTEGHIEDVSMAVLFKTDQAFHATPQTTSHTTHNFRMDVDGMVKHL